jgi:uncharacterized protein YdeI (YjbR/CyaY-like superfamily)
LEKRDLPVLEIGSAAEWETWLAENHAASDGVWLRLAKRASGAPGPTYEQALDGALCYGWIDGLMNPLDQSYWLQRFTPRRRRSRWSERNCARALRLIAEGRMQAAGLRQVEAAKADGRWDAAYPSAATATVPEDLQRALDADDAARAFFETLNRRNRFVILVQIHDAKRPATRAQRIARFVAMLSGGEKPLP